MAKQKFNAKTAFKTSAGSLIKSVRILKPGIAEIAGEPDSAARGERIQKFLKVLDKFDDLVAALAALEKDWPKPAAPLIAKPPAPPIARPA